MGITITPHQPDDIYADLISKFFLLEFPQANLSDAALTLEYVSAAILATNQIRYGALPSVESQTAIRAVIRTAIDHNQPIPILMPFGSRKAKLGAPLDVAEVFALKTIHCLQQRVIRRYLPGILLRMRIEDTSGNLLFIDDGCQSRQETEQYVVGLTALIKVLGYSHFIRALPESTLFSTPDFYDKAMAVYQPLLDYIIDTDRFGIEDGADRPAWKKLSDMGWIGGIPAVQRDYYRQRYAQMTPGISEYAATQKLATYLAGAWARRQLNGTGADPAWGDTYLRLTFAHPVPGAPASMYAKDIYYRTLPAKFANTHIAPWRAHGYMEIGEDHLTPKIASWHDEHDYISTMISFNRDDTSVNVLSDYVLK